MKIEIRKYYFIIIIIIALTTLLCVYFEREKFYILYIQFFHKSAIISHFNKNGDLEGVYLAYVNGKLYGKSQYKNGELNGTCIWFDEETGKKKREVFYKKDKLDGVENVYYKNGMLNYSSYWKNDKRFNSEYHFLKNGILNTYNAFDNNKNSYDSYLYVVYNKAGGVHQILGHVFSPYIYSLCNDSTIALTDESKNNCVRSLYINVATPPRLSVDIKILINDKIFIKKFIRSNILVVPNVFVENTTYRISIFGKLSNLDAKIVKADTLITVVKKDGLN